jgi:GNAT superfamily N-acetyltransferase
MWIERAGPDDAVGIVRVLETVVAERAWSAIDLASLSPREALHVARDPAAGTIGFQSLDLWSTLLPSMAHVGQVGTFLLPQWRGLGVGRTLWGATEAFARQSGYEKIAIQVSTLPR